MKILGAFTLGIVMSAFHAWAFGWMWLWFVVPLGIQNISFLHAWGLTTFIGAALIGLYPLDLKGGLGDAVHRSLVRALTVLFSLGFAWIIQWGMG